MLSQKNNKADSLIQANASFFNIYLQSEWKTSSSSYLFVKFIFHPPKIVHFLTTAIGSVVKTRIMRRVVANNGRNYNT